MRAYSSLFLYNNKGVVCEFLGYGLPNITGVCGNMEERSASYSGAFYPVLTRGGASPHDAGGYNAVFDASRCSSIYGSSNTVQPSAIKMLPIIRY